MNPFLQRNFTFLLYPGGGTHYVTVKRARDAAIEYLKAPSTKDTHVKLQHQYYIDGRAFTETIGLVWVTSNEQGKRVIHVRLDPHFREDI